MRKKSHETLSTNLSLKPVVRYIVYFYAFIIIIELLVGSLYTLNSMEKECNFILDTTKSQLEYRIGTTLSLLQTFTENPYFQDPNIPYTEKARELTSYSNSLGYMMICIVDKDVNVWTEDGSDANLGGRAYMQKLFATGKPQVTDSFAAGADGVTLNYTIAVPIIKNQQVDGCIFAAIYFSEIQEMLKNNTYDSYQQLYLYGSNNQAMSAASNSEKYGKQYMELAKNDRLFGTTTKEVDNTMYNMGSGSHWGFSPIDIKYVTFSQVENTNWTILCRVNFFPMFIKMIPHLLSVCLLATAACFILVALANKFIRSKRETVDMLVSSIQDLEKKIYQNEKPDNMDFKEIISLTSKGLTDGLTGVITRTVFLNQLPNKIKTMGNDKFAAMCFIDVDNLKKINDSYGHDIGDITLKNVGYVLREYEKKYDGLVGRYGGDEFLILLTGFDSIELLEDLIEEMTIRLHSSVTANGALVPIQCSVGVAICNNQCVDTDKLIKNADETLYSVKQSQKGRYKIYTD